MKQCYLCGAGLLTNVNESKDHIPPDCFFPSGTQPMITVPCCITCNGHYQELDEKMRNFIATIAETALSEPIRKAQRAVLRSSKTAREYLAYTKAHPTLVNDNGQPRLVFYFNSEELTRWSSRVVKGLFFHENHRRISDSAIFTAKPLPEIGPLLSHNLPLEKGLERRPYFVYGMVQDDNEPNKDFWVLVFYGQIVFIVTVDMRT